MWLKPPSPLLIWPPLRVTWFCSGLTGFCSYLIPQFSLPTQKPLWPFSCYSSVQSPPHWEQKAKSFQLAQRMSPWSGPWSSSDLIIFNNSKAWSTRHTGFFVPSIKCFHGLWPAAEGALPHITIEPTLKVHLHLCSNVPLHKRFSLPTPQLH